MVSHFGKDLYNLLGVEPTASQEDIKKAYRSLARGIHPDKNPPSPESKLHFERITKAYKTLRDPDLRAAYDRDTKIPTPRQSTVSWKNALGAFLHQFKENAGPWPKRGKDLLYQLHIDLVESLQGGRFEIRTVGVSVDLPAGIESGAKIRIPGAGQQGKAGGPPGDLIVVVYVADHPFLSRQGDDLICNRAIPFTTAALGGEIQVPAPGGATSLAIPPGSKTGDTFRLPGKGFQSKTAHKRGDLVIKLAPETPKDLNASTTKLLKEFACATELHNFPQTHSFETMMHTRFVTRVKPSRKT